MPEVVDWLKTLGMSEYAERFAENRIDLSVLPDLTDQDLEKLGVVLGDRRKMLRAIGELSVPPPAPPQAVPLAPPEIGSTPQLFPVLWGLFLFHWVRGHLETARSNADEMLRIAEQAADPALLLIAHFSLGGVLWHIGEIRAALAHLIQAQARYDEKAHAPLERSGRSTKVPAIPLPDDESSAFTEFPVFLKIARLVRSLCVPFAPAGAVPTWIVLWRTKIAPCRDSEGCGAIWSIPPSGYFHLVLSLAIAGFLDDPLDGFGFLFLLPHVPQKLRLHRLLQRSHRRGRPALGDHRRAALFERLVVHHGLLFDLLVHLKRQQLAVERRKIPGMVCGKPPEIACLTILAVSQLSPAGRLAFSVEHRHPLDKADRLRSLAGF
jgi:hypothetical protein